MLCVVTKLELVKFDICPSLMSLVLLTKGSVCSHLFFPYPPSSQMSPVLAACFEMKTPRLPKVTINKRSVGDKCHISPCLSQHV